MPEPLTPFASGGYIERRRSGAWHLVINWREHFAEAGPFLCFGHAVRAAAMARADDAAWSDAYFRERWANA